MCRRGLRGCYLRPQIALARSETCWGFRTNLVVCKQDNNLRGLGFFFSTGVIQRRNEPQGRECGWNAVSILNMRKLHCHRCLGRTMPRGRLVTHRRSLQKRLPTGNSTPSVMSRSSHHGKAGVWQIVDCCIRGLCVVSEPGQGQHNTQFRGTRNRHLSSP